jgi:hypothetical protein
LVEWINSNAKTARSFLGFCGGASVLAQDFRFEAVIEMIPEQDADEPNSQAR